MIGIFHETRNGMHRDGLSQIPIVRIGTTGDFGDVAAQYELNQTLEADDPRVVLALWVMNDRTAAMCDMMDSYLRGGGTSVFGLNSQWQSMVNDLGLSGTYDVVTDHQKASGRVPFGLLAHTDGKIGGLTASPDPTLLYESAMYAGKNSYLCIDKEHPLTEAPPAPRGAMLALLPWRDEGLFHRAVMTGQDRVVSRASFSACRAA